jgi:hypothetical protein
MVYTFMWTYVLSYKRLKSDSFYIIKTKLVSLCVYFPAVWLLKHKPDSSETGRSGIGMAGCRQMVFRIDGLVSVHMDSVSGI